MNKEEIEIFIKELDEYVSENNLCVYPDKMTIDCCDCYLCRLDYFQWVREDLRKEK